MHLIIVAVIVILDRVTKHYIVEAIDVNNSIPLIDGIFHITYIQNYGAAFSIMQNRQALLISFTTLVMVVVAILMIINRHTFHKVLMTGLALILGGGIGNLIDRVLYGYVVDFFDFRIWPVFNVSDIAVVCGCGLVLIYFFFLESKLKAED